MVRFTLRQCSYFQAVARHGGIAQAARALNVSQPSIAQALDKLEGVTGLRLFDRHHARGTTLTRQGCAFLEHVTALTERAEQVAREAAALAADLSGEIRLGCFYTLAPFCMAGLIRSHRAACPGVRVTLREMDLTSLAAAVRDGSLDAAVTYDLGADLSGLTVTPLASIRPSVVIGADHPIASQDSVWLQDLADEPYVMFEGPGSRSYFEDLLARNGISPPVAYGSTSLEAVRSAVGNGFGFTLLAMHPKTPFTYDLKELKVLAIRDAVEPLSIVLAAREGRNGDMLVSRFVAQTMRFFDGQASASSF